MDVEQIKAHIRDRREMHDETRGMCLEDSIYLHNTGAYAALDDLLRWIERTEWSER